MAKTLKRAKFKTQKRLKTELPGMGRPAPVRKEGKRMQGRRLSDYGVRLQEKQKICFHYGIQEKQLKNTIRRAKHEKSSNWVDTLMSMLESRLDNAVFRLGLARSIPAARQLVRHGHVKVNGERRSFPAKILRVGDKLEFSDKIQNSVNFQYSMQNPRLEEVPSFLSKEESDGKITAELVDTPHFEHVPFALEARYIAEVYGHVS